MWSLIVCSGTTQMGIFISYVNLSWDILGPLLFWGNKDLS